MNEAMAEAIAVGKAKLEAIRHVQAERVAYEQRSLRTQLNGKYAVWRKSLEGRLPAWVHPLIPAEPSGDVSEWRCKIVLEFPDFGQMLFTGVRFQDDERGWEVINVRAEWGSWIVAGEEFLVALGMLAEMHEEELRRQEVIRLEAEEWERQGDLAAAQVVADALPAKVDPMDRIAAVLERLADAVEDIAAVAVTLDGVLETAAGNMSEVRVWGEEEGEK